MGNDDLDTIVAVEADYVRVCWTTESGKEVCYSMGVPREFHPYVPPPVQWDGPPVPTPRWWPRIFVETPRPVPWIRDLSLLAGALDLIRAMDDDAVAGVLRDQVQSAAEKLLDGDDSGATLHFGAPTGRASG